MTPGQSQPPDNIRSELENRHRARQLFSFGLAGLAAALVYCAYTANVSDPFHLYEGMAIFTLAALPALLWAKRGGQQLPVFEVQMITGINAFALPLLSSAEKLQDYSNDTIGSAAQMVLFYQVIAIVTHAMVKSRAGTTSFYTQEVLSHGIQKFISAGLVLSTIYTFINVFYEGLIPYELNSIFRAAFFGVGLVSTFVEMRRWGLGELKPGEAVMITFFLLAQIMMQVSTLFLVGGMSIVLLALIGYVSGSRRIPFIPVALALATFGILHNGKSVMRDQYWGEAGGHRQVALADLGTFFTEWFSYGLNIQTESGESKNTAKLVDRTSLLHILCLIVDETPRLRPYLDGKTYRQIPEQFIPRFFWPDKPPGHISTNTLSIYYGLQDEDAASKTTIGFGFIAEAYANYGFFGVGVIAFLVGLFYKKVQAAAVNCAMLSYAGLFLIVLMAWSFQTEYTMSIWLSSFYQACVAVMGIPFLLRNILG